MDINFISDVFFKYAASEYWNKWYSENKEYFKDLVGKHKKKRRKELQEIIQERKSVPCKRCGGEFHFSAMDLVHRDPKSKNFSLRDATRLIHSKEKLIEEIDKCDVVCANCVKEEKIKQFLKETDGNGSRNRRRKKLRELINQIKTKPCKDCGQAFAPYVMELDHLDGDKKVDSVSKMINKERPIKLIMEELDKTESICTNCHRIRTYNRSHGDE